MLLTLVSLCGDIFCFKLIVENKVYSYIYYKEFIYYFDS